MREESFQYEFEWFKDDFDTDPRTRGRLFETRSPMEEERSNWEPPVPSVFSEGGVPEVEVMIESEEYCPLVLRSSREKSKLENSMSLGVILLGEWVPGSGTHNVVVGIVRFLEKNYNKSNILGFLGGPQGFARKHFIKLTEDSVGKYLNQGGADLLGFGSLSAITEKDFLEINRLCCEDYALNALVFVGGPNELAHVSQLLFYHSSTNANEKMMKIVGVVQSPNASVYVDNWIPITLGFDSACCSLAEYVGNIATDGFSSGRGPEVNIIRCGSALATMEVALRVGPAMTILAEEISAKKIDVKTLVDNITEIVSERIDINSKTTTILLSDKLYQCLPGLEPLREECRALYVEHPSVLYPSGPSGTVNPDLFEVLTKPSADLLKLFPLPDQLRIARAFSQEGTPTMPDICPENWIAQLVQESLSLKKLNVPVSVRAHYIGAEARCAFPTNFDCALGLALGQTAAALAASSHVPSGYIAAVRNLDREVDEWECGGIALHGLVRRKASTLRPWQFGEAANQELINLAIQKQIREMSVPVIPHRPVDLESDILYKYFNRRRSVSHLHPMPYAFPSHGVVRASCAAISPYHSNQTREFYEPRMPSSCCVDAQVSDCAVTTHRSCLNILQLAFPNTCSSVSAVCLTVKDSHPLTESMGEDWRLGIVFLGRSAPGCHNVIVGLQKRFSKVFGFINGAHGLINAEYILIDSALARTVKNTAGLSLLGRTDAPIRTKKELLNCVKTCKKLKLDGLVVVGGIGTHADTALLAEALCAHRIPTRVVGVPASIENDIPMVEQSLGHDSACRVYASIVGSLAALAASKKRQWCFIRLCGKNSLLSHVLLEVALQTHVNLVLTAEELEARQMSLADVICLICDLISERAKDGFDFGTVLFSDSISELFLKPNFHDPEIYIQNLVGNELQRRCIVSSSSSSSVFRSSTHRISTHQGRSAHPSNFDCDLGMSLGYAAGCFIASDRTGLLVTVGNLANQSIAEWEILGVPLTSLLTAELNKDTLECCLSIERRPADFSLLNRFLPPPSKRRFLHPGPMQFRDDLRLISLGEKSPEFVNQRTLVQRISTICSQIMSISASASDEKVRDVLTSGLRHTLALLNAHKKGDDNPPSVGIKKNYRPSCPESLLLRPHNQSHCRVVQLVPVDD